MIIDGTALTAGVLLVGSVLGLVFAIKNLVGPENIVARRLRTIAPADKSVSAPTFADMFAQTVAPLTKVAKPIDTDDLSRLRLHMLRAGFRGDYALEIFLASKIVLGMAVAIAFLWMNALRRSPLEPRLVLSVMAFAVGYYVPSLWLSSRVKQRQTLIERGLPDTLDLLVTCVEAGLGLDGALQRVAAETRLAWPLLGGELELTFLEIKAGIPRVEGFRRLADRTGVAELKTLAATLAQTEIFGTSVGLALRIQAEGIRTRRMNRAEERAGYVSVKMSLPLVFCILPTLVAVVAGPAVIRIAHAFFK